MGQLTTEEATLWARNASMQELYEVVYQNQLDQARAVLAAAGETPVTKREVTWKLRELFEEWNIREQAQPMTADEAKMAAAKVLEHRSEFARILAMLNSEPQPELGQANS